LKDLLNKTIFKCFLKEATVDWCWRWFHAAGSM